MDDESDDDDKNGLSSKWWGESRRDLLTKLNQYTLISYKTSLFG